jgi:outer membrane receptor protein involved in Fe transport
MASMIPSARVTGLMARTSLLLASLPPVPASAAGALEEVTVVGVSPTEGARLDRSRFAAHVQSASADELARGQSLDLTDFMSRNFASVSINSAQHNPLQPDVQFRGFTASPLLGLPQGLAVYQDGVRVNEPLGDAVNWDLLPESAVASISLVGGANPVFGLNTLGGALAIDMKNGFNFEGHAGEVYGGSFDRIVGVLESGGNNGVFGYYANVHHFEEDGWRDLSDSDALNVYLSASWHGQRTSVDAAFQYGESELTGNGAIPAGLLDIDRDAIFTAPDVTENDMKMFTFEVEHTFSATVAFSGNAFYRGNDTDSLNGDASELAACEFADAALIEGLEEDDLEELGLDEDDVCEGQFAGAQALEDFLNAMLDPGDAAFNIEDLSDALSGTGVIEHEAINNISTREQDSHGGSGQIVLSQTLSARDNQLLLGFAWFDGESEFDSVVELSGLDEDTRSTEGLGTGTFLDEEATLVSTETRSWSVYFSDTVALTDRVALTVSGRYNDTDVQIDDRSGERAELNGDHDFERFNPAVGLTWQVADAINLYGSYSESSRAPTPIELSCNEGVFEIARRIAIDEGEDPDDVEFECRLPNAFLADPPLEQVVARSFEVGARGTLGAADYHLGFFHTVNRDDIVFQTTGRATGLFANVEETRRLGFEAAARGQWGALEWFGAYSYIEATFEDDFLALSPAHAFADEDGEIEVRAGDRMPGIPEHQLKLGADYALANGLSVGAEFIYNSDQVPRGDESNQLDEIGGYALVNLRAIYRLGGRFELFARVDNVFDEDYENFGLLGEDPTEVLEGLADDAPIFLGPGAPRAGWVGLRIRL